MKPFNLYPFPVFSTITPGVIVSSFVATVMNTNCSVFYGIIMLVALPEVLNGSVFIVAVSLSTNPAILKFYCLKYIKYL